MSHFNFSFMPRGRQKFWMKLVLVPTLAIVAYLCTVLPAQAQEGRLPWTLVAEDAQIPENSPNRSTVVLLRLPFTDSDEGSEESNAALAARGDTVSVFIDGNYHASFPRASWTYAEVCPGPHFLNAVRDLNVLTVKENVPHGQRYEFPPSGISYFQVLEDNSGFPRIKAVDAEAASAAIKKLPKAVHTISRLESKDCVVNVEPATPVATPQIKPAQKYTLQSATLFEVDKFSLDALKKGGKSELDRIIRDSRLNINVVEKIDVVGHADPTGSALYNVNLSRKRAQTIAQYFVKAGFPADVVSASGRGSEDLVVADCAARFKTRARNNACNEPNRRVEIAIRGHSRN